MPEKQQLYAESEVLRHRLESLQETYRATLNILEDFDEERRNSQRLQRATLNLLEDVNAERNRFQDVQTATTNLLEDFDQERQRLKMVQTATVNLLEDFAEERVRLGQNQRALINILEDIEVERVAADRARALSEGANKELEAFSYSVSHDLRAPLRAISGFTQAVVEDYMPKLDEEGKRYLGLIQANVEKMARLIDDLLAFSRLGRQQMQETEIDLNGMVLEVFDELAAQAPGRQIKLVAQPVPAARGDKAMVRQVLVNLIANAIKFTRTRPEALIEFGCGNWPGQAAYYMKDNGVGFEMQYVNKLFGVFQRLHAARDFEGTGVGLALVHRIITRHGGRVWAEGAVDKGATFYFTLPGETA